MFDLDSTHFRNNQILAALPEADYQRILPCLEALHLEIKDYLYERDEPIEYVYFPLSGMASILAVLDGERYIEAGIVGREGMVGLPVFFGADTTSTVAFYQIPGVVVRMHCNDFRAEIERNSALEQVIHRFAHAQFIMLAQNVACNSQHSIQQRCARWLLLTHDRIGKDEFILTQEFLSQMLGVRRAGVSTVMQAMQEAGYLRYTRGIITILNRAGLEAIACQCYNVIAKGYKDMSGRVISSSL
jgi:CRP-like cAMP-binding protein